jgi:hypothetical protein
MLVVKFSMVVFLLYLTWLAVYSAERMQPRSGPNYYLDMGPASANSIQPEYRVTRLEAMRCRHALEVECFNDGSPYRVTHLEDGVRKASTYYFIDGYGRLRYVGQDDGWGFVRMRRLAAAD